MYRKPNDRDTCPKGHLYLGDNLYVRPDSGRGCRICRNAAGKLHYQKHPEKLKLRNGRRYVKKYSMASRPQPNSCESCGKACKPHFDHNHITGNFRGWLCARCNVAIGHARDNIEILEKLIDYLRRAECAA